jgi:hypothetical protein
VAEKPRCGRGGSARPAAIPQAPHPIPSLPFVSSHGSGNRDRVVDPSERLDPFDRGYLARLHIQLVNIVLREVDPEQLLTHGDGNGE